MDGLQEGYTFTGAYTFDVVDRYNTGDNAETIARRAVESTGYTVNSVIATAGGYNIYAVDDAGNMRTFTATTRTAYMVTIVKAAGNNVTMTAPSVVWTDASTGVTINVTLTRNDGPWASETPTAAGTNPDGTTGTAVGANTKTGNVMTFTVGISSSGGNNGVVTIGW